MERYMGHPIYIATKEWQRRKHRKKRINKKWLKRYGTYELNLMPHEQVLMMDDGVIWMTKKTWLQLKPALERFNPEPPESRGEQCQQLKSATDARKSWTIIRT